MNMKTIDLNLFLLFEAIYEERNLTRAGERVGLSQSAVSHALGRLRQALGDELFIRGADAMVPTSRAEELREPVREAMAMLQIALQPQSVEPNELAGTFRLAVNNYVAFTFAPEIVKQLRSAAPRVKLELRPGGTLNVLDSLDGSVIDIALTSLVAGGERFKCMKIAVDHYVGLVCRGHPLNAARELSLADLAATPHLQITSGGDRLGFVDDALKAKGLTRAIALGAPLLSTPQLLVGSDLIALLPRRQAEEICRLYPLVAVPLPIQGSKLEVTMIWHRRNDKREAHRWLRGVIQKVARAEQRAKDTLSDSLQ